MPRPAPRRSRGRGSQGSAGPLRRERVDRRDILWGYLFLLPALAIIGVLLVEPFVKAIEYSFENWDGIGAATYVGLANYKQIFVDPVESGSPSTSASSSASTR